MKWLKKIHTHTHTHTHRYTHTHRVEYYSAIKKNEIMSFAATWINLKIIILIEISQRKTNTIRCHIYVASKI